MFPDSVPIAIANQFPQLFSGDYYDMRMCMFSAGSGHVGLLVMSHDGFNRWSGIDALAA